MQDDGFPDFALAVQLGTLALGVQLRDLDNGIHRVDDLDRREETQGLGDIDGAQPQQARVGKLRS